MKTLQRFLAGLEAVPTATSWYLEELGEARGRQELFLRQSPQRLEVLREHALVESTVSSNRIEGVAVDASRVATIVFGKPPLRDRNEEELRGYREALQLIHEHHAELPLSEATILELHRLIRGEIWDAGRYKTEDGDIVEISPDGRRRVRFATVPAQEAPAALRELLALHSHAMEERRIPPAVVMAAFNLDFLCIHPFRDGNGRVSRLLLLLESYHLGFLVGRYISLERLIEDNKERYYETLEESSRGWHEGRHNPWPYINYLFFILKSAHAELERRLERLAAPRGAKTELVESAVLRLPDPFTLRQLEAACPGVSRDMVRRVLRRLRDAGRVRCLGRGPGARWTKRGTSPERGEE